MTTTLRCRFTLNALTPVLDRRVAKAKLALSALAAFDKPAMVSFALNSTGELRSGEAIIDSILEVLAFCDERISTASTSSSASGINISSTDNANTVDTDNDNIVSDNTANIGRSTADASDAKSRCTLRAILFSCSQAEDIAKALQHVRGAKELALKLADRGIQLGGFADRISPLSKAGVLEERLVSGVMQSAVDMEVFASFAQRWVDDGATIVGGCCGVPPDYLARIRERAAEQQTVSP